MIENPVERTGVFFSGDRAALPPLAIDGRNNELVGKIESNRERFGFAEWRLPVITARLAGMPTTETASRWLWYGLLAGTILLVGHRGLNVLRAFYPAPHRAEDFFQEWASARNCRGGLPVYAPHLETIPLYLGNTPRPGRNFIEVNAHPPVSVLLALPLSGFDYWLAHLIWNLLSMTALALSIAMIVGALDIGLRSRFWTATGLLMVSAPMYIHLTMGTLNLVLLFLLTGTWWADRSGRPRWAGILLGLATAIKLFPGFLFVYFLFRQRWQTVAAGVVSFILCNLTAAAILGPNAYREYATDVMPRVTQWRTHWPNSSLSGFSYKLFYPGTKGSRIEPLAYAPSVAHGLAGVSCFVVLAIVAAASYRAGSPAKADLVYALSLVAMLLVSPVAWEHYFLLLLLPFALLWQTLTPYPFALGALVGILAIMFLSPWDIHALPERIRGAEYPTASTPLRTLTLLSLQFYALLALFGLMLLACCRSRNAAPDEDERAVLAAG